MAVCYPIHHRRFGDKKTNSRLVITLAWVTAAGLAFLHLTKYTICAISLLAVSLFLTGFLMIIYGLIAQKIILNTRQQNKEGEINCSSPTKRIQCLVVINSAAIVTCDILCSCPWMALTILKLVKGQNIERNQFPISLLLYIMAMNSLLNPLIYFFISYYRKRKGIR